MTRRKELKLRQRLAREVLIGMLNKALEEGIAGNIERAELLGEKARKFAKNFGIKIPHEYKWYYCKKCKTFLIPGVTMRVRLRTNREPHISIYCAKCRNWMRIYFKRKRKY